jgi:hypothetical protein
MFFLLGMFTVLFVIFIADKLKDISKKKKAYLNSLDDKAYRRYMEYMKSL